MVIRGGSLFAGTGHEPVANAKIVVRNGLIACIGADCESPPGAVEIPAEGRVILPGLIDLHGHLLPIRSGPGSLRDIWEMAQLKPGYRRAMLEAGVTTFRSVGDPRDGILDVKRMLEQRELAGPRMFVVGPIFTAPGGHPTVGGKDPNPLEIGGAMAFQSDDPAQVSAEVRLLAANGADGIKAVFHGRLATPDRPDRPARPTLSHETLRALIETAHAHGLWVAVHVGPSDEAKIAADMGADTLEHGVRNGYLIDDETLRSLVANKIVYVPTLGREPEGPVNIPAIRDAGVTVGVGTDGEDYHEELARLVAAGMSPPAVLVAATANGAKALRKSDVLGTIEVGKIADIVIANGAPWSDIGDLRSPAVVIQGGYVVVDRR